MESNKKVAIFGSSQPREGSLHYEEARAVGNAIASAGYTVVTGGYRGVMEAASRGAKEAGGKTIGITTGFFGARNLAANEYIDTEISMPSYAERLLDLTEVSDAYVVMRGGSGTLSELFLTWELVKNRSLTVRPIVLYGGSWRRIIDFMADELGDELSFSSFTHLLGFADTPEKVVELIRRGLRNK